MDLFPFQEGNRSIPSAPGARQAVVPVQHAAEVVRTVLAYLDSAGISPLFPVLAAEDDVDDDPDLGSILGPRGARLVPTAELAILPPSLRFNRERYGRVYRVFAAGRYANGVNGYALAPSEWRPGLAVWGYSEGGVLLGTERGSAAVWLAELMTPLDGIAVEADDPAEKAHTPVALAEIAADLWKTIAGDLPAPQPRPDWSVPAGSDANGWQWRGETVAGRAHGLWTFGGAGVVQRQETYADGRRHGAATRWHIVEEPDRDAPVDPDDDYPEYRFVFRQGHIACEGQYVDGAAHGPFRFFDEVGQPAQEGAYEHGWPEGRWIVHPPAAGGLAEPAVVNYAAGVPVSWSIPPPAYDSVELTRDGGERTTLARLAHGHSGIVLIDCADAAEHDLSGLGAKDLAEHPDLLVLGVHPTTPGPGRLAGRAIDIVADPTGGLARAYRPGPHTKGLFPVTYLDAEGGYRNARLLARARFTPHLFAAT